MRGEARKEIETSKLNDCGTLGVQVTGGDFVFKIDALNSHILHIPYPENLTDTVWAMKWAQVKWLIDSGIVAPKQPQ